MRSYRTISRALIIAAVMCLAVSASAEKTPDTVSSIPGIQIRSSVDVAEAYIGDLITYQITIVHDSTIRLIPPPLGANLGSFDVKDYQADVETKLKDGRVQNQTTFVLSTFTTGNYVIPPLPVVFMMPDSTHKVMLAEGVPIKIKSLIENAGDSARIRALKGPYEFKRNLTPYYIWGGVILLVLAVAGYLWWRWRNRKRETEVVDLRPAWEIAFEKLALLKERHLLEEGNHKEYYIELSEIVRAYLGRMYAITVLDMTTSEFLDQFQLMTLPEDLYDRAASFLQHADLVKFAKYVPDPDRSATEFQTAHDIVETVRIDYERKQQAQVHLAGSTQPVSTADSGGAS